MQDKTHAVIESKKRQKADVSGRLFINIEIEQMGNEKAKKIYELRQMSKLIK